MAEAPASDALGAWCRFSPPLLPSAASLQRPHLCSPRCPLRGPSALDPQAGALSAAPAPKGHDTTWAPQCGPRPFSTGARIFPPGHPRGLRRSEPGRVSPLAAHDFRSQRGSLTRTRHTPGPRNQNSPVRAPPEPEARVSPAPSPRAGARPPGRCSHDGARDSEPLPDQRAPQRAGPLRAAAAAPELQPQPRRALVPRRQGVRGTGGGRLRPTEPGGRHIRERAAVSCAQSRGRIPERGGARGEPQQQVGRGDHDAGEEARDPVGPGHHPHPQALPHGQPQRPGPVAPLHQQADGAGRAAPPRGPGSCPRPGASAVKSCPDSSPREGGSSSFGSGGYMPRRTDGARERESWCQNFCLGQRRAACCFWCPLRGAVTLCLN